MTKHLATCALMSVVATGVLACDVFDPGAVPHIPTPGLTLTLTGVCENADAVALALDRDEPTGGEADHREGAATRSSGGWTATIDGVGVGTYRIHAQVRRATELVQDEVLPDSVAVRAREDNTATVSLAANPHCTCDYLDAVCVRGARREASATCDAVAQKDGTPCGDGRECAGGACEPAATPSIDCPESARASGRTFALCGGLAPLAPDGASELAGGAFRGAGGFQSTEPVQLRGTQLEMNGQFVSISR
jgi:hypothetical protein